MSQQRRLYSRVPTPGQPRVGNASQQNPQGFGVGFDPASQPDEVALQNIRRQVALGIVPIEEILAYINANNLPPQLNQGTYLTMVTAANTPALLIPKNLRRQSWEVDNFTNLNASIVVSFDEPQNTFSGFTPGRPLPQLDWTGESNGSVSLNDIWVTSNNVAAGDSYPFPVLGYEGTLALTGNPR